MPSVKKELKCFTIAIVWTTIVYWAYWTYFKFLDEFEMNELLEFLDEVS